MKRFNRTAIWKLFKSRSDRRNAQEHEVRTLGNDIANKKYELFQHGTGQGKVWGEAVDEEMKWHTEDVMDEATLEKIGKAIEGHEI